MTKKITKNESLSLGALAPSSSIDHVKRLIQCYRKLSRKHCQINSQKRQLMSESAVIEMEKLKLKRHLIHKLEGTATDCLDMGDTSVKLSEGSPQLIIYNKKAIPKEYTTVQTDLFVDKLSIKKSLLKGFDIPGVKLQAEKTVEITAADVACTAC